MKKISLISAVVLSVLAFVSCENANYKTTASGLKYKIIDGGSKDSSKEGDVLKMEMTQRLTGHKDTLLQTTYGKMPVFAKISTPAPGPEVYGPDEVFKHLKKGDSLIAIIFIDSAIKKGIAQEAMLPPFIKKGDKITYTFKVMEVFKNDSLAQADYAKEMERDAPRQKKEQEAQMEKMRKDMEAQQKAEEAELEKSGEKNKQIDEVQQYLTKNKVNAVKTPMGVFVKIDNPGSGAAAADGKFVTVKYTGKKVHTDSTFEGPNTFTIQMGKGQLIRGFENGISQFKQGGKGTIYIPGFLAYGKNPPPGSPFKAFEPLYFDVEITSVGDKEPVPEHPVQAPAGH